jgi:hypothetical protein
MNKLLPLLFYAAIIYLSAKFSIGKEPGTTAARQPVKSGQVATERQMPDSLAARRAPMLLHYTASVSGQ